MPKLVWRVKLVAERQPEVTMETELARIERDEQAGLAQLGLRLAEAKQLTAALQAEIVPAQMAMPGERGRPYVACGRVLASKSHCGVRFRSLFGDVPVRIRQLHVCPCQGLGEAKSFAVLDLGQDGVAPEPTYVTARHAALMPFGKVASLLSELLPMDEAQNTGTVRNKTLRAGQDVVHQYLSEICKATCGAGRRPRRGWAGWRLRAQLAPAGRAPFRGGRGQSDPCRWCPAPLRLCPQRLGDRVRGVPAGAHCGRSARGHAGDRTVRRRRRAVAAAARGAVRCHDRAGLVARRRAFRARAAGGPRPGACEKWRLWHGRWPGCQRKLAALCCWTERKHMRDVIGIGRLQRHASELLGYLECNGDALVHYAARRRRDEPIPTASVASAVGEIIAKRMNKKQQMRWNRATVQPLLDVCTAVLNDTLEDTFRYRHSGFRPANDNELTATAA